IRKRLSSLELRNQWPWVHAYRRLFYIKALRQNGRASCDCPGQTMHQRPSFPKNSFAEGEAIRTCLLLGPFSAHAALSGNSQATAQQMMLRVPLQPRRLPRLLLAIANNSLTMPASLLLEICSL
ncbi:MAG: hypothetical protein M3552_22735, partial [Planctomycetota bacterium]|nr:hypothetical protein [Planctomycetota bacterium]